ncbi:orotate phosphoribosyltransferase [Parasutterella sp.]|uniref:orotate phosphoribosyltransferase n=1 Tax=Parasutterella sp. TaxID=2049037 RepID=UPI003520C31D
MAKHFGFLKLAKRLAAVIDPVCQSYKLGASVTPDCLRLTVQQVRIKDENPYDIDPDEDPRDLIKEVLLLEIGLPNPLFVRRFTMFQPSVEKALAEKGFGAMKVKPVIDRCGLHPQQFLFTETGPAIGGPGAVEGAKELSDRLPGELSFKGSHGKTRRYPWKNIKVPAAGKKKPAACAGKNNKFSFLSSKVLLPLR